ncbi:LRRC45 [Symbiodinium sp. CCMP2592]|nr:LRRC45 [Symbiodinium sp. CCMP2592]
MSCDDGFGQLAAEAILDTGSFELVVFSTRCNGCGAAGESGFNQTSSQTFRAGNLMQQLSYGSGDTLPGRDFLTCQRLCRDAVDELQIGGPGPASPLGGRPCLYTLTALAHSWLRPDPAPGPPVSPPKACLQALSAAFSFSRSLPFLPFAPGDHGPLWWTRSPRSGPWCGGSCPTPADVEAPPAPQAVPTEAPAQDTTVAPDPAPPVDPPATPSQPPAKRGADFLAPQKQPPSHPPTTGGLPAASAGPPKKKASFPPARPATPSFPPAKPAAAPSEAAPKAPAAAAKAAPPPLETDLSFLCTLDDDAIYRSLADLPPSQVTRLLLLIAEVAQDVTYAMGNLGQLDVEVPVAHMSQTGPLSADDAWRPCTVAGRPDPNPAPPNPTDGAGADSGGLRVLPGFARPRQALLTDTSGIDPNEPLVHSDPNRPGCTPVFVDRGQLTPRRANTGPWTISEGWERLSIFLPETPGPFIRTDSWPWPDLFCFEEQDLPSWAPLQDPPSVLSHLQIRGYCSHDCPARGPHCLRICLRHLVRTAPHAPPGAVDFSASRGRPDRANIELETIEDAPVPVHPPVAPAGNPALASDLGSLTLTLSFAVSKAITVRPPWKAEVINRIRSGYRPLQPVGRGSSKPLPDFRVSLPPPDSNMGGMAPRERSGRSRSPRRRPEPAEEEVESTDLSDDSSDSEQSGASGSDDDFAKPRPPRSQQREPSMNGFLHNPRSNVLHRPVPCPPDTAKSVRVHGVPPRLRVPSSASAVDPTRRRQHQNHASGTPVFDDPAALVALLRQWSAPDELLEVLTVKGFKTIATIAYAIPPDGSPDDWIRVLWPPADPNDTLARITPAASFARRLLVQARDLVHPAPAPSTPASAGSAPPSLPGPKITAEAAELLRQKFIEAYPGEVLSPSSTPSLEFLNRHLSMTFRRSMNIADLGPVEPLLRRHFGILVTALAFLGDLHLRIGKIFAESFIASATAVPLDPSLRAPSLQEVLAADRSIWAAVGTLMRDEKWSLSDSIHEVSVTRHMIPTLLCARPRSMPAPPVREPSRTVGTADTSQPAKPDRPTKRLKTDGKPEKPTGKAKADAKKPAGKKPVKDLWEESWHEVDENGKEICKRFVLGRCKLDSCSSPDALADEAVRIFSSDEEISNHAPAESVAQVAPASESDRLRSRSPHRPVLRYSFSFVRPPLQGARPGMHPPSPCARPAKETAPSLDRAPPSTSPADPPVRPALFLDLFSGCSAPLSKAISNLGLDRIAPIDVLHGEEVDLLLPQHQSSMRKLCSSGLVRVAVAAPPCSSFSRARLKPGGPPAVRTPAHPHGIPAPSQRQQAELQRSDKLHELCRELLTLVLLSGGLVLLENPSSSLLWLTDPCKAWIRHHCLSAVEIAACTFGMNAKKSWTFVSNLADLSSLASACCHPPGTHPPLTGKRDSSGAFLTRTTACYPDGLCERFAALMAPYLSRSVGLVPFLSWETALLEPQLCWPLPSSRIEDGAGSCSTASWSKPSGPDTFGSLRKLWVKRILSGDFLAKFRARLASGSKDAPISESELVPFLGDLRSFLGLAATDFDTLLSVPPGQPFRLFLLDALLQLSRDPDRPFVDLLLEGVPLGVDEPMPACPTLFPASATKDPSMDLQHCSSSWGSALSDLSTVDSLLQTEVSEGWVREVPGGLDSLVATYARTAVGKLGLVKAPDRDPRLVVDSSVSGVTEHTTLPNKSANPTISGLRRCFPLRLALEQLFALILGVSKAHRRILIRAADQGLLCFFHRGRLFQCLTLNFGARASGFYWARLAGILSRLMHRLLFIRHALLIYVDDLISLLSGPSAPVWAAVLCVFLLVLRVPMSWHKAYLGARPTWIGWSMSLETFTATLEPPKLARLRLLISSARSGEAIPLHLLRKLTGKLLWVCSLFRPFRPSLAPLYRDQSLPPLVHVAVAPSKWESFRAALSKDLVLTKSVGLASCPQGCTLVSVASRPVRTLKDVPLHFAGERRLWISVRSPPDSDRKLSQESKAVLDLWHSCLCQTIPLFPLSLAPLLTCEAFADACADSKHPGLGGFVAFPSGRTVWFRSALSPADLARLCAWYSPDISPQKFIAAWELLCQIALLWCVALVVPAAHHPVHFVSRCDNSPSESASWKGLSTARGMCDLLHSYLLWQRHFCISAHIDHVPGFRNKIADALSRSRDPGTLGLNPADEILVPWHLLSRPPRPCYSPASAFNRDLFPALDF